jgi:hypothetical protein
LSINLLKQVVNPEDLHLLFVLFAMSPAPPPNGKTLLPALTLSQPEQKPNSTIFSKI